MSLYRFLFCASVKFLAVTSLSEKKLNYFQVFIFQLEQKNTRKNIIFSLTLFLLFGITWMFGFLLFGSNVLNVAFAYIFTIINTLQGTVIKYDEKQVSTV